MAYDGNTQEVREPYLRVPNAEEVNTYVEAQVEYETEQQDAGDRYLDTVSHYDTVVMERMCRRYSEFCKDEEVKAVAETRLFRNGRDWGDLAEIAMETMRAVSNTDVDKAIAKGQDERLLSSFAVGEIEIQLPEEWVFPDVQDVEICAYLIRDTQPVNVAHLTPQAVQAIFEHGTDLRTAFAYWGTNSLWFAVVDMRAFHERMLEICAEEEGQ